MKNKRVIQPSKRVFRFNYYWDGRRLRLTVRPGECVRLHRAGPTEEGWDMTASTLYVEGGNLFCEVVTDGRDCDGRFSTYDLYSCTYSKRAGRPSYFDHWAGCIAKRRRVLYPVWCRVEGDQRDYLAEAMGY